MMTVSDQDLDNAVAEHEASLENPPAEEIAGEETEVEETQTEELVETPVVDEPEDNAERSRLGRKVKMLEDQLKEAIGTIEKFKKPEPAAPEVDEEEFVTFAQARRLFKEEQEREREVESSYNNAALSSLVTEGADLGENEYLAIVEDAKKNWVRHTNNPAIDAKMNFLDAQNRALKQKVLSSIKPANPLKKNDGVKPENLGGPSDMDGDTKPVKTVKLDKYAADFAKKTGMSDKRVSEVLSKDMPLSLASGGKFKI